MGELEGETAAATKSSDDARSKTRLRRQPKSFDDIQSHSN
jgi:hypothetical protein